MTSGSTRKKQITSWLTMSIIIIIGAFLFSLIGHTIHVKAIAQPTKMALPHEFSLLNPNPIKEIQLDKQESILIEENIQFEVIPEILQFEVDAELVNGIPDGMVALTFDDGPSPYTTEIVDTLKKYRAGGTFFLVGSHIYQYPDNVAYIHENGYSIGNHSMNHINLASKNLAAQRHELLQSSNTLQAIIGKEITLFRPPYGAFNDTTKIVSQELGQKVVLWNNDPKDWQSRDAQQIINHIKSTNVSGSIILLHETKATLDALPEIITYLQEQDLQLVTLH